MLQGAIEDKESETKADSVAPGSRHERAAPRMADIMVFEDGYPRHLAIAFSQSRGPRRYA
jgi:hypothetical protein